MNSNTLNALSLKLDRIVREVLSPSVAYDLSGLIRFVYHDNVLFVLKGDALEAYNEVVWTLIDIYYICQEFSFENTLRT